MFLCSQMNRFKEVVVHLLCLKDFFTILSTNSVKIIIVIIITIIIIIIIIVIIILIIIVAKKELGISSIVLSTKDKVLLPIGEENYQLVFGAAENGFGCKIAKLVEKLLSIKYYLLRNCVILSVTPQRLGSRNEFPLIHETSHQHYSSGKQKSKRMSYNTFPFLQVVI